MNAETYPTAAEELVWGCGKRNAEGRLTRTAATDYR